MVLLSEIAVEPAVVGDDLSAAAAVEAMTSAGVDALVVRSADGHVLAALDEPALATLADTDAPLAELADQMPALIVLGAEPDEFSDEELTDLAEMVSATSSPAVLLVGGARPVGVVFRRSLASALSLTSMAMDATRAGNPNVPALRYVCVKCTPPSFQLLRAPEPDGRAPSCTRLFHHGVMEAVR
ncbi:hypothetical protein ACFQ68_12080 [Amycolatopsis japonica]|uniref:hypothetical protein n=1 Tax=Amycolatopsis japonica TaxID=208439 RepID=UPI00366E784F